MTSACFLKEWQAGSNPLEHALAKKVARRVGNVLNARFLPEQIACILRCPTRFRAKGGEFEFCRCWVPIMDGFGFFVWMLYAMKGFYRFE